MQDPEFNSLENNTIPLFTIDLDSDPEERFKLVASHFKKELNETYYIMIKVIPNLSDNSLTCSMGCCNILNLSSTMSAKVSLMLPVLH